MAARAVDARMIHGREPTLFAGMGRSYSGRAESTVRRHGGWFLSERLMAAKAVDARTTCGPEPVLFAGMARSYRASRLIHRLAPSGLVFVGAAHGRESGGCKEALRPE